MKYKGVQKYLDGYRAFVKIDSKQHYLGFFKTAQQAAKAYDVCLFLSKGVKAKTNFNLKNYL